MKQHPFGNSLTWSGEPRNTDVGAREDFSHRGCTEFSVPQSRPLSVTAAGGGLQSGEEEFAFP
jgi:hypothetical protein